MNVLDEILRTEKLIKKFGYEIFDGTHLLRVDDAVFFVSNLDGDIVRSLTKATYEDFKLHPMEAFIYTDDKVINHLVGEEAVRNGQENI